MEEEEASINIKSYRLEGVNRPTCYFLVISCS